jgi:hypothetical protein
MTLDTPGISLAGLDSRGGELDESFQEIGHAAVPAGGQPKRFPGFVGFPVVAVIE